MHDVGSMGHFYDFVCCVCWLLNRQVPLADDAAVTATVLMWPGLSQICNASTWSKDGLVALRIAEQGRRDANDRVVKYSNKEIMALLLYSGVQCAHAFNSSFNCFPTDVRRAYKWQYYVPPAQPDRPFSCMPERAPATISAIDNALVASFAAPAISTHRLTDCKSVLCLGSDDRGFDWGPATNP
jgi:hypothetical protein